MKYGKKEVVTVFLVLLVLFLAYIIYTLLKTDSASQISKPTSSLSGAVRLKQLMDTDWANLSKEELEKKTNEVYQLSKSGNTIKIGQGCQAVPLILRVNSETNIKIENLGTLPISLGITDPISTIAGKKSIEISVHKIRKGITRYGCNGYPSGYILNQTEQ